MSISTQSGASAFGAPAPGVNGVTTDTIIIIPGPGQKDILSISYSLGANGAGIPAANLPAYTRLVVIEARVAATSSLKTGWPRGGMGSIEDFGGRIMFDVDLQVGGQSPLAGQFFFPSESTEGRLRSNGGDLSIILTAAQAANGGNALGLGGKLTLQYKAVYGEQSSERDYDYARISRPLSR